MSLAKPNGVLNTLSLARIEALTDETYNGGKLPLVVITCNGGLYGTCHDLEIRTRESDPSYCVKCCVITGNMNQTCYSSQEHNCIR
jgi:hypothetical protein